MRFAFTPRPPAKRQTPAQAFRWFTKREPRPTTSTNMEFYRCERMIWKSCRKPNRFALGIIRAMGAKYFFNGCHPGAEDD